MFWSIHKTFSAVLFCFMCVIVIKVLSLHISCLRIVNANELFVCHAVISSVQLRYRSNMGRKIQGLKQHLFDSDSVLASVDISETDVSCLLTSRNVIQVVYLITYCQFCLNV